LDLNGAKQQVKKQRFNQSVTTTPAVLNSPDLQMLKLGTPELEKFILSTNGLPTPTPGMTAYPTTKVSLCFIIYFLLNWIFSVQCDLLLLAVYLQI
jgi:hypothetical protein